MSHIGSHGSVGLGASAQIGHGRFLPCQRYASTSESQGVPFGPSVHGDVRRDLNVCLNQRVHQLQGDLRVNSHDSPSIDRFRASLPAGRVAWFPPRGGEGKRKKGAMRTDSANYRF